MRQTCVQGTGCDTSGTPVEGVYVGIWYIFFVGLPIYGILYVGLKLREYLREIEAILLKQQT